MSALYEIKNYCTEKQNVKYETEKKLKLNKKLSIRKRNQMMQ